MALQVGAGERKKKNVPRPELGQLKHLPALLEAPPYVMREFRISDESYMIPIGTHVHARHFVPGQNIDVAGLSKGKGFQGGMKRHGFGGMPVNICRVLILTALDTQRVSLYVFQQIFA